MRPVRLPGQRIGAEQHQVSGVADGDRAPPVGGGGEGLACGDRLLRVPGLALVTGAVDRGSDRQPRVERRHRCVRAHDHVDPVVEHPAQREAAVAAPRPEPLGHVAVVEQVGRLDTGADAEPGHPAYVLAGGELDVLDAAAGARLLEGGQRLGDRPVADRVHGHLDATGCGTREQLPQLLGGLVGLAVLRAGHRLLGVRLAAPGRAGVERAVADDLERPHRQPRVAVERVARCAGPRDEHVVEAVGVARMAHPDEVCALGPPRRPVGDAAAELEVHEADHAERRGGLHGAAVGVRAGAVAAQHGREAAVGHEPLALADDALAGRQRQHVQGRGVEPAVVAVAGDEHDRLVGLDRVEVRHGRVVVPRRRAVAPPDHRQVRPLLQPLTHLRDGIRARPRTGEVQPRG